jgi:succinyl-CoA synthetase beta subunit
MLKAKPGDLASVIAAARADGRTALTEPEAKAFLRAQGIPVPAGMLVASAEQAAAAVAEIGPPVVVKAVAHQLTHKSDAGAVLFPIDTPAAATAACRQIAAVVGAKRPDIELEGFLIEAYRPAQPEWILALRNDPGFGPVVMFGLGGIYVDVLRQVSFRLAPLSDDDIDALIADKPAMRILDGFRGKSPADRAALKQAIRRLSDLALQPRIVREIADIEINPLTVTHEGVLALDALIVLRVERIPIKVES